MQWLPDWQVKRYSSVAGCFKPYLLIARGSDRSARLQVEHDKFVAESEKRLAVSASEADGLRRALDEAEKATAATAEAQRVAEARASQAEQVARDRVANLTVRPETGLQKYSKWLRFGENHISAC